MLSIEINTSESFELLFGYIQMLLVFRARAATQNGFLFIGLWISWGVLLDDIIVTTVKAGWLWLAARSPFGSISKQLANNAIIDTHTHKKRCKKAEKLLCDNKQWKWAIDEQNQNRYWLGISVRNAAEIEFYRIDIIYAMKKTNQIRLLYDTRTFFRMNEIHFISLVIWPISNDV